MRRGRRCQMPACGKAPNPNPLGVYAPFLCPSPNAPQRSLRILKRRRMTVAGRDAIAEDKRSHTERVQILRRLPALMIHREMAIASARTDNHGSAGRLLGGG